MRTLPPNVDRVREEAFGGVWQTVEPPALVYVDREAMRGIGVEQSELWDGRPSAPIDRLVAPTEAHLALTNRCDAACPGCYMSSGAPLEGELDTAQWKQALDRLRAMGVFHIAMGGGESTLRRDLFELAAHARSIGLVPNLTTNGRSISESNAAQFQVFGIVNVSVDGMRESFWQFRGYDGFPAAERALSLLQQAGVQAGINCVVNRGNFDELEALVAWAAQRKLSEIEFLRFKPSGRGREEYDRWRLESAQGLEFIRRLRRWTRRYKDIKLKVDCSFVPFLASAGASPMMMRRWGVTGCEGANVLVGVKADGRYGACSFSADMGGDIRRLPDEWESEPRLLDFLKATHDLPRPCSSCRYRDICRGGCHVVASHVEGTVHAPDPECPRVVRYRRWMERLGRWRSRLGLTQSASHPHN